MVLLLCVLATSTAVVQAQESSAPPTTMPFRYGLGFELYQENCTQCHGARLGGTDEGPPLLHKYYVSSHHDDQSFYRAIRRGAKQHHWRFGDMAPIAGIDERQAYSIVEFVRWFQKESGLE